MISHNRIWKSIDSLAKRHDLTPSGLARLAGLDPTAFNPSKRTSKDGRARWPSMESIAKVLNATGEDMSSVFCGETDIKYSQDLPAKIRSQNVPLLGFAEAGAGGYFDGGGFPVGQGWDEIATPFQATEGQYALKVSGDSMLPAYRDGDILILSPHSTPRRGDRVVVRTQQGEVMAKVLHKQTTKSIELHSINPDHAPRKLDLTDVDWVVRIVWASQ